MKLVLRVAALLILAALGYWLWSLLFPSPESIVLKKVSRLAALATLNPGEGNLVRAGKVSSLIGYFSTDAEVSLDMPGGAPRTLSSRDEIREAAAAGFTSINSLTVQFQDALARVDANRQGAEVSCTAQVSIGDRKDFGPQELRFHFQKIAGDWLITRLESVKTLQ